MSRSRMFGDDDPGTPSPRTTIVGGQPERGAGELPPVPTGIQRLLRLASVDEAFRRQLVERRGKVAEAAGVTLTPSEDAILAAIPAEQLEAMAATLPPPDPDRRSFLRQTAASAVVLLGGAVLGSGCPPGGVRSENVPEPAPPRRDQVGATPAGIVPDVPPPPRPDNPPGPLAGARLDPPPPRPDHNDTQTEGGAAPRRPPPRPEGGGPRPAGARPDLPPPREPRPRDGGTDAPPRPDRPPKTRGISPDVP